MSKPLPAHQALFEPWFQALRTLQADRRQLRTLEMGTREYGQAVIDVFHARQAAALRAQYPRTSANNEPLDNR